MLQSIEINTNTKYKTKIKNRVLKALNKSSKNNYPQVYMTKTMMCVSFFLSF